MKTKRTLSGFMATFLPLALMMYVMGYIAFAIASCKVNPFKWEYPESTAAIIYFTWATLIVACVSWFHPSLFKSKSNDQ